MDTFHSQDKCIEMPHQCLNCGRIIERGSNEILKGCQECGGKKFMYVDQPMPESKRKDIKDKADMVRDQMLKKADREVLELLRERGIGEINGKKVEVDESLGEEWIRIRPEREEKIEIDEGEPRTGLEVVRPEGKLSARDLISQFDREMEKKEAKARELAEKPKKERAPRKKKAPKKEIRKPSEKLKKRRPHRKKKEGVDVIQIVETGVYEIDLEKLLDDNPLVIEKDGSYLIHLPSLFREGRDKKKEK
ncbi:MAG: Zn-ribbon containing protein [Thermoplasmatota archaeon]